jgi:hypothetical protein
MSSESSVESVLSNVVEIQGKRSDDWRSCRKREPKEFFSADQGIHRILRQSRG